MTSHKTAAIDSNDLEVELGPLDEATHQDVSLPTAIAAGKASRALTPELLTPALHSRARGGVAEMMERFTGLTSGIAQVQTAANIISSLDRVAGVTSCVEASIRRTSGIDSAVHALRWLDKAALGCSAVVEAMAGVDRTVAGLSVATEALHALNQVGNVTAPLLALNMAREEHWSALSAATVIGRQMEGITSALEVCHGLSQQFERMARFDSRLSQIMRPDVHDVWSCHLRTIAVSTADIFARDWARPIALLSELPEPGRGASVSWKAKRKRKEVVQTAALTVGVAQGDVVIIDDDPICAICGKPLLSLESEMRLLGPGLALRQRRIYPICLHCGASASELVDLLQRAVASQRAPKLRVVQGEQAGDGVCRGRGVLRLVTSEG